MDRNTIIGLGLIGVILVTFTLLNKPSEEELKAQKKKAEKELALEKKQEEQELKEKKEHETNELKSSKTAHLIPIVDDKKVQLKDKKGGLMYRDTLNKKDTVIYKPVTSVKEASEKITEADVKGELIRLETDKLIIDISTKGGIVAAAYLKEYESYRNFISKSKKAVPLKLFGEEDAKNELVFKSNGETIHTGNKLFEVVKKTKKSITLAWTAEEGKTISYTYKLKSNAYDLDYQINQEGFDAKDFNFSWTADLYKTERLLSEQRKVSTICYKYKNEDFSWLSEVTDDDLKAEHTMEWIAFKQSYFTTIMKPQSGFTSKDAKLKIRKFEEKGEKDISHIKHYSANVGIDLAGTNASAKISWFFGPNDYEVLKSYDSGYEDIINYGWGLFRWINIYAIQPTFNVLASSGLGFGLVILLLTLLIKLFLTPIQWKMYVSSAKMKLLKPEIEQLNAKYPNKEDAMKKQMDTMALYRASGASPLAGCIPMLIQMPILLAVFRFFPAAFELRQKPFLWAEDLSSYDSVLDFNTYIWGYGDHISLFTLLMSATTLIYTWLNSNSMQQPSQPGMPNMKVIMYIFPFMMIFFFNNFSSGLSYYYFISTLISILIMLAIKQFFVDEEKLKAKMQARKVAKSNEGPKKKSAFQERMEQMQKAQQEKLKGKK